MFFSNLFRKKNVDYGNTIAILYICTGRYYQFWIDFYKSCEKYFCTNSKKHYFIFTDQVEKIEKKSNMTIIFQPKIGWPYDTLNRFHYFNSIKSKLIDFDYTFFFNANMIFINQIDESEILPSKNLEKLVGVIHPGFYNVKSKFLPFERNKISTAYISPKTKQPYFQGCLSGGNTKAYLKMSRKLSENIDKDTENQHIAIWHDESHLNHFFLGSNLIKLDPGFAFPEMQEMPFRKRIVQLDKSKLGGHDLLRQ